MAIKSLYMWMVYCQLHSEQQTMNVLALKPGGSTKIWCCYTRLGVYLFAGCRLVTGVSVQARLLSCARPRARLAWSPAASPFVSAAPNPQEASRLAPSLLTDAASRFHCLESRLRGRAADGDDRSSEGPGVGLGSRLCGLGCELLRGVEGGDWGGRATAG